MNKIIPFILLLLTASCDPSEKGHPPQLVAKMNPHEDWVRHSLQPFGMKLELRVPKALSKEVKIRRNDNFGRIEFSAGESVDFIISGDFESVSARKFELESGIFTIEYVEDQPEFILYKAALPDESSPYFNFVKVIAYQGEKYVVENNPLVEFSEKEVRLMSEIVETIKPE